MIQTYHQLMHLAQAYFHQDFDLDAPTPLDVVHLFAAGEPAAAVIELVSDLESVLSSAMTDKELRELWIDEYGASYDPLVDGSQYRQWFTDILYALGPP
jgi:CdiI immunity protein